MSRPNLWWSYDPEHGSFSALPAGPLLLPALFIVGVVSIIELFRGWNQDPSIPGIEFTNSEEYQAAKARRDYLIQKMVDEAMGYSEGLTVAEAEELRRLK